ncbi:hypothetical protein PPACK8108_LOCUS16347 [Phakopsora pachyrhizi]|uniref:Uncharacterized protein n=1 Tax=Phakopsora pachyrhizi TaxID=170000 RepID=A0AAV0BCW9_PHAPC|nr:hypothetical protein PPACK8108_LOCUS16347 [Phakopsora pachyrhizi]
MVPAECSPLFPQRSKINKDFPPPKYPILWYVHFPLSYDSVIIPSFLCSFFSNLFLTLTNTQRLQDYHPLDVKLQHIITMSSENKQLFSSKDEDTHPKKYFKTKATNNICHPSFLAGTSQQDFIRIMLHQLLISTDVESYTKGTDSESRVIGKSLFSLAMNNLQNKPKEWKLKYLPKSFCTEENEAHSIILKNIIVQEGNPEQQIPRLIELAKLEHLIATNRSKKNSGTKIFNVDLHSSIYLSKKMASKIDFSMVVLPTDLQVEQELIKDSDSSQNNGFTSEE